MQAKGNLRVCVEKILRRAFTLVNNSKESITALMAICADGNIIPPSIYFPGQRLNPEYALGFPPSTHIGFTPNGWMDTCQLYGWLANHFIPNIPPHRPVLLLLDGHGSHVDYHTMHYAKENGIHINRFPAHCSHAVQPEDRGHFGVVKHNWKIACAQYAINNPGAAVTKRTFAKPFMQAFDASSGRDIIKTSFRRAGIWPINFAAIDKKVFEPARMFRSTGTTVNCKCCRTALGGEGNVEIVDVETVISLKSNSIFGSSPVSATCMYKFIYPRN